MPQCKLTSGLSRFRLSHSVRFQGKNTAGRDEESQRVMAAAMRYVESGDRSELETFSISVLRKADYQLSNRDNGSEYRNAIKDRIAELEKKNEKDISTNKDVPSSQPDVIEIKPNVYGVGINFNELWRRARQWLSKKKT